MTPRAATPSSSPRETLRAARSGAGLRRVSIPLPMTTALPVPSKDRAEALELATIRTASLSMRRTRAFRPRMCDRRGFSPSRISWTNQTCGTPARRAAKAPVHMAEVFVTTRSTASFRMSRAMRMTPGKFQARVSGCFQILDLSVSDHFMGRTRVAIPASSASRWRGPVRGSTRRDLNFPRSKPRRTSRSIRSAPLSSEECETKRTVFIGPRRPSHRTPAFRGRSLPT